MNSMPTAEAPEVRSETVRIPDTVVVAFHEAMQRDGRMAAMNVIAGRGYGFTDVLKAASAQYGTEDAKM